MQMNISHVAFYKILYIFWFLEKKLFLPSVSFFRFYKNDVIFSSFYYLYLKY